MLLFKLDELLLVFQRFNLAIWPMQIIAYLLGLLALFLAFKRTNYSIKLMFAILAFFWLWTGVVFCLIYWAPCYPFAYGFAALCIIQGLLFLYRVISSNLEDDSPAPSHVIMGSIFVIYAMAGYPALGYWLGHVYPKFIAFGLVPCPTAVFTFGVFLLIRKKIPVHYFIVPLVVAMAGLVAAMQGIYEDIGLFLAGLIFACLQIRNLGKRT